MPGRDLRQVHEEARRRPGARSTTAELALAAALTLAGAASSPPTALAAESSPHVSSPGTVRAVAIFPGVVVHGIGHVLARDYPTARVLLLAEAVGYAAMFTAAASGTDALDRSRVRGVAFGAGAALFLGSWAYDVVRAPSVARAARARAAVGLVAPGDGGIGAGVIVTF